MCDFAMCVEVILCIEKNGVTVKNLESVPAVFAKLPLTFHLSVCSHR